MVRTINTAERNIYANGAEPITVPANNGGSGLSTDVLPDQTKKPQEEIAYRYIYNAGNGVAYYAFGQDCSTINWHGQIAVGQQLDCSNHRLRVSVCSPAGTTIGVTILFRDDLGNSPSVVNQSPVIDQ